MKSGFKVVQVAAAGWLLAVLLLLLPGVAPKTSAATLWTGANTNFTQSASNFTDVLIPGAISFSRNFAQWLFNPAAGEQGCNPYSPTNTEWAFGSLANYAALNYQTFSSYRNGDLSAVLVGNPMVVHLIPEDIYLSLTFTAWPQHGGFFAYTRSTPAAVSPTPSVTITNPASGAVFAAPANVKIGATATVASGSVTNVAFFAGITSLGAVQSAPFGLTAANLSAGAYSLTAVATASGVSATSAVVAINVVNPSPLAASLARITNGQFTFNYSANPGLGYVIQDSSNLVNWQSLATNVATTNSVHVSENFTPKGYLFYRVGRLPNP
jgi:hypothetical protein